MSDIAQVLVPQPRAQAAATTDWTPPPAPGPAPAPVGADMRLAWAAVGALIASSAVLGLALVLASWPLTVTGVALGATGLGLARRGHLLESPAGDEAPRDLWPLGPRAARPVVDASQGPGRRLRLPVVARRHPLFAAAAAVVALHVADDSFLQPASGTGASDHLASGLVPLGLLGLAAWAYPHVRPGTRAAASLTIGLSGLFVGVEAGYYTWATGPSGDDFTGLLAILAGIVLLGLGTVQLWRSRRRGGSRLRRWVRRTGVAVLAVVAVPYVVLPVGGAYMTTHLARAEVPAPRLGAPHEEVVLHTSDGLELDGWYVPSRNGAAVIAFPGRKGPQAHTRMLVEHGYGVLLFDRRGEGTSDGDGNMFGWGGSRDIHAAVDFLDGRSDVEPGRIGGLGLSVGGELMLQAAAENPGLAAVVSEGAGSRSLQERHAELSASRFWTNAPALVLHEAALAVFSNEDPPPTLMELAPRIAPRPALLIWAPDGGTSETMTPTYGRLIGASASLWGIDDAKHLRGLQTRPAEYERRVVGFFDDALL